MRKSTRKHRGRQSGVSTPTPFGSLGPSSRDNLSSGNEASEFRSSRGPLSLIAGINVKSSVDLVNHKGRLGQSE